VTVRANDGSQDTLHTTWHHPFWNPDRHTWTEAADLTPGARLSTSDGRVMTVVATRAWTQRHEMRDLTVAVTHTYYVVAGTTPVLVHNCGGLLDDPEAVTERLQSHVDNAAQRFESGELKLTTRQAKALQRVGARGDDDRWQALYAAFRGQRIDAAAKEAILKDPELEGLYVTRSGEFGPDISDPATSRWWDITTERAWQRHVDLYRKPFGFGTLLSTG